MEPSPAPSLTWRELAKFAWSFALHTPERPRGWFYALKLPWVLLQMPAVMSALVLLNDRRGLSLWDDQRQKVSPGRPPARQISLEMDGRSSTRTDRQWLRATLGAWTVLPVMGFGVALGFGLTVNAVLVATTAQLALGATWLGEASRALLRSVGVLRRYQGEPPLRASIWVRPTSRWYKLVEPRVSPPPAAPVSNPVPSLSKPPALPALEPTAPAPRPRLRPGPSRLSYRPASQMPLRVNPTYSRSS